MCLIALAYQVHAYFPLIVLANRDEFLERPARPAHFWQDKPGILAGRDERAGGTWLGLTTNGRFAALTNHRDLRQPAVQGPSRGQLVVHALEGVLEPTDERPMDGYNLIHGPVAALKYRTNILGTEEFLRPGIHGLSNALLNTPWPKVERLKDAFARLVRNPDPQPERLFDLLLDRSFAPVDRLPDTGLDVTRERELSPAFIAMPGYGTRCSTLVMVDKNGGTLFEERTYQPPGIVAERLNLPR
jgi:uncharacterized protein with NRDE domain